MSRLLLSFDDYIKSPSGKGSSVNSTRESTNLWYSNKLNELIVKNGEIKYNCYSTGDGTYYIVFRMPSESTPGFYYDTVVELSPNKDDAGSFSKMNKYLVKFYSNDPDFTFTYAHAYKIHGLIIDELEKKVSFQALHMKANTKNPDNVVGYVRNIYYAYLIMQKDNLFDKGTLDRRVQSGGLKAVINGVKSFDEKAKERKSFNPKSKDAKEKKDKTLKPKVFSSRFMKDAKDHTPHVTKATKITAKTTKTKTARTTKYSKKIK